MTELRGDDSAHDRAVMMRLSCPGPLGLHHPDESGQWCLSCDRRLYWTLNGWAALGAERVGQEPA